MNELAEADPTFPVETLQATASLALTALREDAGTGTTNDSHGSRGGEAIVDRAGLFVHSGLVDQLRDTTAYLISGGCELRAGVVDQMVAQYEALRQRVTAALDATVQAELAVWAPALARTASLHELHAAAAMFARWIDQLHATPQYLAQHQVAVAATKRAIRQLDEVGEVAGEARPATRGNGTYL